MNGYQLIVMAFASAVIVTILWAIWAIVRSSDLRLKPLWIAGSLFGFVGLGINWTKPDDLVLLFGVMVPAVTGFTVLITGQTIIKAGLPIVAVAALIKIHFTEKLDDGPRSGLE
ncbi:hypothetical protein [Sphingomonas asaccharolytica]|uniref:hypothetical protein n=1 Tax=Sphingomonas asaccharolytica TaxID=40681 RepID=UPI0008311B68|nr:hypothetical protein [Sphingomonas asaccharolytica]